LTNNNDFSQSLLECNQAVTFDDVEMRV